MAHARAPARSATQLAMNSCRASWHSKLVKSAVYSIAAARYIYIAYQVIMSLGEAGMVAEAGVVAGVALAVGGAAVMVATDSSSMM